MAQKHLHELLKEDQEPFLLKNYISNKRTQLKRTTSPKTTLQLKKQNSNFCKNACFLSLQTKSPLFDLTTSVSPPKTPNRSSNPAIFLNIPAKTASLLLDAALRIHKHSKTNKNNLFGSFFKRITQRGRNRKSHEETDESVSLSVKDILKWESSNIRKRRRRNKSKREEDYNGREEDCNGRTSSAVWSESNEEDKSLDMETSSSSGHSCEEQELRFVDKTDCACFDDHGHGFFCESPFHFVLQRSPSSASANRTPELSSPPASPTRHRTQDKENNGGDGVNKFQSEEEDKEQNSPVSVLDPPFDDVNENDDEEETSGFDLECGYANVQRTKQLLLDRLRRFEQLAELDPIELERRMLEDEEEDNEDETFTEEEDDYEKKALREIVYEVMCHSSVRDKRQDPEDLRRLVYDLIREEDKEVEFSEDRKNVMMRRVCKRLELWNEVESNTIDMMIEEDLSREESGRKKKNGDETREVACEIEVAIFCFLVEEFSEELLVC